MRYKANRGGSGTVTFCLDISMRARIILDVLLLYKSSLIIL